MPNFEAPLNLLNLLNLLILQFAAAPNTPIPHCSTAQSFPARHP
jgi:hypothetical protein